MPNLNQYLKKSNDEFWENEFHDGYHVSSSNLYYCDFGMGQIPFEGLVDGPENIPQGLTTPIIYPLVREANQFVDLNGYLVAVFGVPGRQGFDELPGTKSEISAVTCLFDVHQICALEGAEATLNHFKQQLVEKQPSILHFATHAKSNSEFPEASFILLAPENEGQPETSLLTYSEILDLDLSPVDLVVFSACQSGVGKAARGIGVQSLARAFLQAGATYVLATRFLTNDHQAAALIPIFYRLLKQHPPAIALMKAKQKIYQANEDALVVSNWSLWS